MPLDATLLSTLMLATSGLPTPDAKKEFDAYAAGIVAGLKTGTATVTTTGLGGGPPGTGSFVGAINPGPAFMAPLIQTNAIGSLPPIPGGTPQPLQITFFLALAQTATHILSNLQVDAPPTDAVSAGVGIVTPGGFSVPGSAIEGLIILEFAKAGLTPTPSRLGIAKAVGIATEQLMLVATMPAIPITGAPAGSPPPPVAGSRVGIIS